MLIITPDATEIFEYPYTLSENDSMPVRFRLRPPIWEAGRAYTEKKDVIIPTVFNGFQYPCTSGGISGSPDEPVWGTLSKATTNDNQVTWKAEPYKHLLVPGQTISASTWEATGCTLSGDTFTDDYTQVQIAAITAGVTQLTLTNTITCINPPLVVCRAIHLPVVAVR